MFECQLEFTVTMDVESPEEAEEFVQSIVVSIASSGRLVNARIRDDYAPPAGDSYKLEALSRFAKRFEVTVAVDAVDEARPLITGLLKSFADKKNVEMSDLTLAGVRARKGRGVSKGGLVDDVAPKGGSS